MLIITGTFRVPVDAIERARPAMTAMLQASRAEEGCLLYAYSQDVLDPGLFYVNERWTDAEALQAHSHATHMAAWRGVWAELGIGERNLRLYETDEGRVL
jgi:quinol monooxygenase YgiN